MGPNLMQDLSSLRRENETQTHTEWALVGRQGGRGPGTRKEEAPEETMPKQPLISHCSLQNCEKSKFLLFKPPNPWYTFKLISFIKG